MAVLIFVFFFFFFQAEDGIRDGHVTGVQTCALPILSEDYHFSLADKEWFSPDASNEELVARLDTEIEWDRETAFRLIRSEERRVGKECRSQTRQYMA